MTVTQHDFLCNVIKVNVRVGYDNGLGWVSKTVVWVGLGVL